MSMLLTCCFRDQSRKGSRRKKHEEEAASIHHRKNVDGQYLIVEESRKSNGSTVHSATLRSSSQLELKLSQEKHPPSKEAKRLLKQRSQESFKNEETLRSRGTDWTNHRASIPYIDQSPQESVPVEYKLQYADNRSPDKRASTSTIGTASTRNSVAGLGQSSGPCPTYPLPPQLLPAEAWSTGSPPIHSSTPLPPYSIPRRFEEEPVSHLPRPESADYPTPRGHRQESVEYSTHPRDHRPETADYSSSHGHRPETADGGQPRGHRPEAAESGQSRGQRKSSTDSRKSSSHSLRQQQLHLADETPVLRGLQRSTAFHDANLLQEQIKAEEAAREREKEIEERLRSAIRDDFERALQAQVEEQNRAIEKVRAEHAADLQRLQENHQRELHRALTKSKNEENERISQFNQSLENERQQFQRQEEELRRKHREAIFQKDADIKMSQYEAEARDKQWQEEKAEVLAEVQRLKEECGKMVALLAQEIEEEALSENRKMTLSQEAASLHLVLEMRNQEVRTLREKAAYLEHRLEKFENVQEELKKARARVEDLEEQIRMKDKLEKQLSHEKTELEQSVERNSKAAVRMSQNVEELQWRIRNNFELPLSVCAKPTPLNQQQQPASLPDFSCYTTATSPQHRPHSTIGHCNNNTATSPNHSPAYSSSSSPHSPTHRPVHRHSMFAVSQEMMEATTTLLEEQTTAFTACKNNSSSSSSSSNSTNNNSPTSPEVGGVFAKGPEVAGLRGAPGSLEPLGEEAGQEVEQEDDEEEEDSSSEGEASIDSLDEGLGDINCDNEAPDSPQPRMEKPEPPPADVSAEGKVGLKARTELPELILASSDNRLPSRISFETPM